MAETDAPQAPRGGGGGFLQKRYGPLPGWGWAVLGLTGGVAVIYLMRKRASTAAPAPTGVVAGTIPTVGQDLAGAGPGGPSTAGQGNVYYNVSNPPSQTSTGVPGASTAQAASAAPVQGTVLSGYQNNPTGAQQYVAYLYSAYLGRSPDQPGLNYWAGQLTNGASPATIAAAFANSPEGKAYATAQQNSVGVA